MKMSVLLYVDFTAILIFIFLVFASTAIVSIAISILSDSASNWIVLHRICRSKPAAGFTATPMVTLFALTSTSTVFMANSTCFDLMRLSIGAITTSRAASMCAIRSKHSSYATMNALFFFWFSTIVLFWTFPNFFEHPNGSGGDL